jgi:glycosyltransferase involved in cell wall biosynthesis
MNEPPASKGSQLSFSRRILPVQCALHILESIHSSESGLEKAPKRHLRRILVAADYYEPGFLAGGPIQSLVGMAAVLAEQFDVRIVTRDRDIGSRVAFQSIPARKWTRRENAQVFYLPPGWRGLVELAGIVRREKYDLLYLNSLFSPFFSLLPLLVTRITKCGKRPVIIAPRGELSPNALALKRGRKELFIRIFRLLGFHRHPLWQATSPLEEQHLRKTFGRDIEIEYAPNIRKAGAQRDLSKPRKRSGELTLVFLSRVSRKKNLGFCIDVLNGINRGSISFDIYGPIEDAVYWRTIEEKILALPVNVHVRYRGIVEPPQTVGMLSRYQFLFLPTLGENYGHAIVEAFLAGCPVIISDQTPWRMLAEKQVGWDLALENPELFKETILNCIRMEEPEYRRLSERAAKLGKEIMNDPAAASQTISLFLRALSQK